MFWRTATPQCYCKVCLVEYTYTLGRYGGTNPSMTETARLGTRVPQSTLGGCSGTNPSITKTTRFGARVPQSILWGYPGYTMGVPGNQLEYGQNSQVGTRVVYSGGRRLSTRVYSGATRDSLWGYPGTNPSMTQTARLVPGCYPLGVPGYQPEYDQNDQDWYPSSPE